MAGTGYTVGEIARAASVTVRTLHHYDEIGLLTASGRSQAGYRLYAYDDLVRLQRVLGYRELGLPLEEIAAILDDPAADPVEQLRSQHRQLGAHITRLQRQLAAVERTMEAHKMGIQLTPDEMFEVFGEHDPTEHAAEAEQRWGDTDAYRESHRRTSSYTKADWEQIKYETAAVEASLAVASEPASSDGASESDSEAVAESDSEVVAEAAPSDEPAEGSDAAAPPVEEPS